VRIEKPLFYWLFREAGGSRSQSRVAGFEALPLCPQCCVTMALLVFALIAALPEGASESRTGIPYPTCEEVRVGLAVTARLENGDGDAAGGRSFRARRARRFV
jgi:hypothetical protein